MTRNFGLLWVFVSLLCAIHLWSSQKVYLPTTKRTILQRSKNTESSCMRMDVELDVALVAPDSGPVTQGLVSTGESTRGATVHWTDLSYAIPTKDGFKRLLCEVEGYVEPGTLTALMGATGAGKTTLLDVLSMRKNVGIVTGEILVNGYVPADGYERMSGYAQQADYHLATATVREALHFSADLRQHSSVALPDKLRHADEVMSQLGMDLLADAIVGTLNTEQRKRLTIGMELAAKPDLLLFLDEPTSGMDSQTAFQICSLLQRLARLGHTIMCTIHQPSASILDMFDRLLLIEQGGRTIYFGNLGTNSIDMIRYFQLQGARTCGEAENPAEWMFEVTSAKPQRDDRMNWHETWIASQHRQMLRAELAKFARDKPEVESTFRATTGEFAVPFTRQLRVLLHRTMVEYWRTPSPLYAKLLFYCGSGLVIGVSCYKSPPTIQGLQNLVFALFLLFTTLSNVMQKIVPQFSERRALFEARERSSKTFSWQAFIASSVMVEAFWQTILAVMTFAILYFLTGFQAYTDSSNQAERGGLMLLLFVVFFLFTSSLSHMLIVGIEADEAAVNVGQLLFYLMLIFCGAIMTKADLPRFWIFMYRVSPLTYFLRSMFAVGVARQPITCSDTELVTVPSSPDRSCGEYLESFVSTAGGRVVNPEAVHACKYCPLADTDQFLSMFSMAYSERWRDLAIVIAFVLVNIAACFVIYWFARVPKRNRLVQLSSG
jgi:ATP-binding cassette subfamily G (WHITE) protein 2 (PDR)